MNLNPSQMEEHQARLILDITHVSLLPTLPALQEFSATKSHFLRMEKKVILLSNNFSLFGLLPGLTLLGCYLC